MGSMEGLHSPPTSLTCDSLMKKLEVNTHSNTYYIPINCGGGEVKFRDAEKLQLLTDAEMIKLMNVYNVYECDMKTLTRFQVLLKAILKFYRPYIYAPVFLRGRNRPKWLSSQIDLWFKFMF